MKTVLFCPLYLDGKDPSGSSRIHRNLRWYEWYTHLKVEMGFDDIWMCDNGSSPANLFFFHTECPDIKIHKFPHIERSSGEHGYGYCWRALYFMRLLVDQGYEKIITVDSDTFILSTELVDFIRQIKTGWQTFFSDKYKFPMSECHVICEDTYERLFSFTAKRWQSHLGELMERSIPFTHINAQFNCERFGELRIPQTPDMDLYSQAPTDIPLERDMK